MKITNKMLSIPPFVTTPWGNISAIYMDEAELIISLQDGSLACIPDVPDQLLGEIFAAYEIYLDDTCEEPITPKPQLHPSLADASVRFGLSGASEVAAALTHDSTQRDAPDLPKEILEKIGAIAKVVAPEEMQMMPKAEPHCNCPHCQISRSIHSHLTDEGPSEEDEIEVTEADLAFRNWDITEMGENLYTITNPIDETEMYRVFIGEPVGCTCGESGCEHIEAVLRS
jgi:hypothetical protein